MNPKRFWGKDMSEALRSVRSILGNDALIVETENLASEAGGGVEITALGGAADGAEVAVAAPVSTPRPVQQDGDDLRQELATLKSMLGWLAPGLNCPDRIVASLLKHGLAPEALGRITEAMKNSAGDERERLYRAVAGLVPSGGRICESGNRLALIGPTGVGKTTAIIKLTVFETQRRSCRVGWIDMDERRLATGDLLAVYAGILGARYQKAVGRAELKQAFTRLDDCDLILIDTPGVNPRDAAAVRGLGKTLQSFPGLRQNLLISAVTNGNDMIDWIELHKNTQLDGLFFTKMDECRYLGPILNAALRGGLPLSYMTLGQNLSGDLALATPEVFASLILTGVDAHD